MCVQKGLRAVSCDDVTVCLAVANVPTSHYSDFETQWSRKYDNVVYAMADATQRLGGSSCVRSITPHRGSGFSQCSTAKHVVLFGSHLIGKHYPSSFKIPPQVILYNMEQVEKALWFTEDATLQLLKSHDVWDYSLHNIEQLRKLGVNAVHVPVGYADGLTFSEVPKKKYKKDKNGKKVRIKEPEVVRDIDVLLIGSCNARRSAIITALSDKGFVVRIISPHGLSSCTVSKDLILPPSFGRKALAILMRAKIFLSTHYFETGGIMEIEYIAYCLANSQFVISEVGYDEYVDKSLAGGVVFTLYEDLVETCIRYLADEKSRQVVAMKGYALISQHDNAPNLRCLLFGVTHVVNRGVDRYTSSLFPSVRATHLDSSTGQLEAFSKEFVPPPCFRVVAIMTGQDDDDMLELAITDLIKQGIDVHFIDKRSSDNTVGILKRIKRLYPGKLTTEVLLSIDSNSDDALLRQRKSDFAKDTQADWIIDLAANEVIESPWGSKVSVRRALFVAEKLGYNMIDFGKLLLFHSHTTTNASRRMSSRSSLLSFSTSTKKEEQKILVKAWRTYYSSCRKQRIHSKPVVVTISTSDTNQWVQFEQSPNVFFPEYRLCPYTFVLRRYPDSAIVVNDVFNHSILHRASDNGHIPVSMLASYLPCI